MVCLGFEHGATGWQAQAKPLATIIFLLTFRSAI